MRCEFHEIIEAEDAIEAQKQALDTARMTMKNDNVWIMSIEVLK